ncbi:MAG: hypothetical protein AAGE01_04040 [Pseudomonadota bacterium]
MESAEPVVRGRFQLSSFRESWKHCSQASNYLAKLIVDQLPDTYYLYSAVINELFEVIFRDVGTDGIMDVEVSRSDNEILLDIRVPDVSALAATWQAYAAAGSSPERRTDSYLDCLGSEEPNPALGLLQISADYDVQLDLREDEQGATLRATMSRGSS